MKEKISQMLADAYRKLGITDKVTIAAYVVAAHRYLRTDREHYVEIADADRPEYLTSVQQGTICSMVPLAISTITDQGKNYREVFTAILYLTVSTEKVAYACAYTKRRVYDNPDDDVFDTIYGYPFYRYVTPDDFIPSLEPRMPEDIEWPATDWALENFRMCFAAYAKYCLHLHSNFIPHYAEKALVRLPYTPEDTRTVDGKSITAQFVPLLVSSSVQQKNEKDCYITAYQKLFLAVSETLQRYVLQTTRTWNFLKEVPLDDGEVTFEKTDKKEETIYQFVELDDIRGPMAPY